MQPLYLNAPEVRRVSLDGPALKVVTRRQADRHFPLPRLSRVVSRGPIAWTSPALLECLRRGVPVTFLNREGQLLGMSFGAYPQDSGFNRLLDAYFSLEAGPQRLVDWFRSHSRSRLLALLRRQKLHLPDLRIRAVRQALGEELKHRRRRIHPSLLHRLRPLTTAQVGETLTAYRIQPAILEPIHDWRGLTCYLTGLLEWEWWEWALSGRLRLAGPADQHAITACYETHAAAIGDRTRNWIGRLWRWLEQNEAYT
ncbi:MAG: hypothetical protein Kow0060_19000 [Methylohalobius crimeensis]